jgi:hypothetical protein
MVDKEELVVMEVLQELQLLEVQEVLQVLRAPLVLCMLED